MPGRHQRGGAKSAPHGTSTRKKAPVKKAPLKKANAKPKKPLKTRGKSTSYGREDHRHAPKETPASRKKLKRDTTGVDEDLDYGAGTRGHRGWGYAPSPVT
jgi:hypothetical protein